MKDRYSCLPAHANAPAFPLSGVCLVNGWITSKNVWPLVTPLLPKPGWVPGCVVNDPQWQSDVGSKHIC